MTQLHDTTESIKGKHLTKDERAQIEILNQESYSNRAIAKRLERAPQTINNEIKRGTVRQLTRQKQNGKKYDYYHHVYETQGLLKHAMKRNVATVADAQNGA